MRRLIGNLILLLVGFILAFVLAELASRFARPVFPGVQLEAVSGPERPGRLTPGAVFHQVGEEYRALTTITDLGYRVPESHGMPEEILLGDSFTWGQGLADDETFPWIYCRALNRSCANLGLPGSGTGEQLERLDHFLTEEGWRPKRVQLFVLAMTASFSAGNDLADNLAWAQRRGTSDLSAPESRGEAEQGGDGVLAWLLEQRETLLRHSNLARLVKFHFGPMIKGWVVPELAAERLELALAVTGEQLHRLDALARQYGFGYEMVLLHPVQDIARGTADDTRVMLDLVSPRPLVPTAPLFADSPNRFYYPLDGHFNPQGARTLAEFLITREKAEGEVNN